MMLLAPELFWLCLSAVAAAAYVLPIVVRRMTLEGVRPVVMGTSVPAETPWLTRLTQGQRRALESLAIFAALILTANVVNMTAFGIEAHARMYFWLSLGVFAATLLGRPCLITLLSALRFLAVAGVAWAVLHTFINY